MKLFFTLLVFLTTLLTNAQKKAVNIESTRPKLVIGIVVDQMKMDYLYRYADDFSANGFKKLISEGYSFNNMHFNYLPTYTAPGHASIFTGATPNMHGIISNEWFNKKTGKRLYCTDDESVKLLGIGAEEDGQMSPKNLLTTTITDELKLTTNFKGKVIGMSMKDRGAILPAGHFADWAFWLTKSGAFVSSSFYGEKLPDWTTEFNNQQNYMPYINKGWNLLKPLSVYNESLPDDSKYEGKINGVKAVFPFDLKAMFDKKGGGIIKNTPFGNDYLIDFAKRAIEKENLGADNDTDFLTMSFSSPDYIGHDVGSRAIETQDNYLRLDENIASFIQYLDKKVGKGNYLLFLTADHGGAENSAFLKDNKLNINNIEPAEIRTLLKQHTTDTFGENLIANYSSFNISLNKELIKSKNLNLLTVKQSVKDFLMTLDHVKRVYTEEEILANSGSDFHLKMIANGFDPQQSGDLVVLDKPGYIEYSELGTTHGTTHSYDTHVPCIFYGWNIPKGSSSDRKEITQIAPTIAQKIKITMPNGTQSKVLTEIFK